jgi:hypothetical protein
MYYDVEAHLMKADLVVQDRESDRVALPNLSFKYVLNHTHH